MSRPHLAPIAFHHACHVAHLRVAIMCALLTTAQGAPVSLGQLGRIAYHVFDRAGLPRPWGL